MHFWADAEDLLTLPDALDQVRQRMIETGAKLLVIDPGPAFMAPEANGNSEVTVRAFLRPLALLAAETGASVLVVAHLRKGDGPAGQRVLGGVAWRNAPRLVLILGRHPDAADPADPRRVLAVDKSNYGVIPPALELTIRARDGEQHPTVAWGGEASYTADDLTRPAASPDERSALDDAVDFLKIELAERLVQVTALRAAAEQAGHAWRTVERAKTKLGVVAEKAGAAWSWRLPDGPPKAASLRRWRLGVDEQLRGRLEVIGDEELARYENLAFDFDLGDGEGSS